MELFVFLRALNGVPHRISVYARYQVELMQFSSPSQFIEKLINTIAL